jgi:hypothetical protein
VAGLPYHSSPSGTSQVTRLAAPIIAQRPMVTPPRIVELAPIEAPRITRVRSGRGDEKCLERG